MAIEANIVPGSQRYRVRTAEERVRAFAKAERHSRVVAILRKALPVIAVLVLASYFISTRLSVSVGDLTASIGAHWSGIGEAGIGSVVVRGLPVAEVGAGGLGDLREADHRHRVVHRDRTAVDLLEELGGLLEAAKLGVVVLDVPA